MDVSELIDHFLTEENLLALKIKYLDAAGGGSTQPVSVGGEYESVDDVICFEGVQMLALVQVPKHGDAVLSSRGSERAIRGNGDGVDVAGVTVVVGLELELRQLPHLVGVEWCQSKLQTFAVGEHTLTTLSHPLETITGLATLGLNRTQETLN